MIRRLVPLLLLSLGAVPVNAQHRQPSRAELAAEIRHLLVDLRGAAAHRDWASMRPSFPAEGPLTARIRGVVTGGPGAGGLSFWTPSALPDFEQLSVIPVKEGLVALSIPFVDDGNPGAFGAVFERYDTGWRLTCFREAFPPDDLTPSCVSDVPRRM